MPGRWSWWMLATCATGLAVVLAAAYAGSLGPLRTCGADAAPVCIAWPGLVSAMVWLTFIGLTFGLGLVQARQWRRVSVARRELVLLGILLAAALAIRLWRIDLALVGYDEAAAASLVAAWRLDGLFPLTGIVSSIGIPNPPAWPYLLALVLLAFDSPLAVVLLGIAASLLSIGLTWWLARRWIGPWGALGAALFYGSSFWISMLGRSGWQPVFLQVPVILCLDALLILAIRRWPWALALACGWLALMVQLHYIAGMFALALPIAAWAARAVLRPVHLLTGVLVGIALLTPFLIYELNPAIRLRDFVALAADSGAGAHVDLESWNLFWTLAGGRGAAGLGATDTEGLQEALGRWSNLALVGIPLVAAGVLVAVGGWPRGWRGWLLAAWTFAPVVGLARHTIGVIFHYLYLAYPGMALSVGALAEWSAFRRPRVLRAAVWTAVATYAIVSTATLLVVLQHVDRTGVYPALARPLGLNLAVADAARAVRPPGGLVLVGGTPFRAEIVRFSLSYALPSRTFDDCATPPPERDAIYVLDDEHSPAATALSTAGAPLLARVPRPDGAFVVYGSPRGTLAEDGGPQARC